MRSIMRRMASNAGINWRGRVRSNGSRRSESDGDGERRRRARAIGYHGSGERAVSTWHPGAARGAQLGQVARRCLERRWALVHRAREAAAGQVWKEEVS